MLMSLSLRRKREKTSTKVVIVVCFTTFTALLRFRFVSLIGGVWSTCPPNDAFNLKETVHLEKEKPVDVQEIKREASRRRHRRRLNNIHIPGLEAAERVGLGNKIRKP